MRFAFLVLIALLSGCGAPPVDPSVVVQAPPEWSLCRWEYPDGQPLECDGDAQSLSNPETLSPDWVCTYGTALPQATFRLFYSPVKNAFGVYSAAGGAPVSGYVGIGQGDSRQLFNWSNEGPEGFYVLGTLDPQADELEYAVYRSAVETNDPRLPNATTREAWSWHAGESWLVHHVESDGNDYPFYNVTRTPFTNTPTSRSSLYEEHDGYHLNLTMRYLLGARFSGPGILLRGVGCV